MPLRVLRRWWSDHGFKKFYATSVPATKRFAMNAGSEAGFAALAHELGDIVKPGPADVVLDIGGGDGRLAGEVFRGCRRVVIFDMCLPPDRDGARRVVGDMNHPPFKSDSFTIVFSHSTFPHVCSAGAAFEVLRRWSDLLKQNGTMYVGDIPERAKLFVGIRRGFLKRSPLLMLKYFFAISVITYFSRDTLRRSLSSMGYEVRVVDQSSQRRFHKERFDLIGTKGSNCR